MTSSNFNPNSDPAWNPQKNETGVYLDQQTAQQESDSIEQNRILAEDAEKQRLEAEAEKKRLADEEAARIEAEKNKPNPLTEIGTALVGGGIDAVEGIGETAERVATGNLFSQEDPNWKPTWLQVADEEEPMNRTVWGKVLRGVTEFGLLALTTKGAGKLAAASKIPGIAKGGAFIAGTGTTLSGNVVRGAATGAFADFVASSSTSDTITTDIVKVVPWFPSVLATNDADSPAARKFKNVLEGAGLGMVADVALGGIASAVRSTRPIVQAGKGVSDAISDAGKTTPNVSVVDDLPTEVATVAGRAGVSTPSTSAANTEIDPAQIKAELDTIQGNRTTGADPIDAPSPTETPEEYFQRTLDLDDPEVRREQYMNDSAASRAANEEEYIQSKLEADPDGVEGLDPIVNSPLYNKPDSAVLSTGSAYENALQMLRMGPGNNAIGSRVPLFTESALYKRLSNTEGGEKVLRDLEKQIDRMEIDTTVDGVKYTKADYTALAAAKYVDIMDASMDPDMKESMIQVLLEGVGNKSVKSNPISGDSIELIDGPSFRAAEMVINTTAQEISDRAMAIGSINDALNTDIPMQRLYDRLKLLVRETAIAKYFKGYDLQQLKNGNVNPAKPPAEVVEAATKRSEDLVRLLQEASDESPAVREAITQAYAFSNGDIPTMEAVHRVLEEAYGFKPGSVVYAGNNKPGALINSIQTTMYQSILSAPKTLARALLGTSLNIYMRPVNMMLGGVMSGDRILIQNGMHQLKAGFEAVGEAWELSRRTAHSMITSPEDVPYYKETLIPQNETPAWKGYGELVEREGTIGQKAAYHLADALMSFNNMNIVKYPTIGLNSIDAGTRTIMGRMQLKQKALERAREIHGPDNFTEAHIKQYETELRNLVFNNKDEVIDAFANENFDEAALMRNLRGPAKHIDNLVSKFPIIRPFFMFVRTGANALEIVQKHTPLLANFNDEVRAILDATPDNLEGVRLFGISTPEQLLEAKAVTKGRIAMGTMTIASAVGLYASGNLTGNGPADRDTREAWEQTGWRPRSIKLADGTYVNYDGLEPFSSFLALVADIGDNTVNMGESWTENALGKLSFLIGQNVTNKSFLSGLGPFNDLISGKSLSDPRGIARIANGFVPWAGLRGEIANVINPGLREVEKDFGNAMLNMSPVTRGMLPYKRDVLDGSVLREYDFPTRMFNSISPIQLNITRDSETRQTLREIGYDFVPLLSKDSKGNKLTASQRSLMQNLMGEQNVEAQLKALLETPEARREIETYRTLRQQGVPGNSPDNLNNTPMKNSPLFIQMDRVIQRAKRVAEAQMRAEYPELNTNSVQRQQRRNAQRTGQITQLIQENQ